MIERGNSQEAIAQLIELYQSQLFQSISKSSFEKAAQFKRLFDPILKRVLDVEACKHASQSLISNHCLAMRDFLQALLVLNRKKSQQRHTSTKWCTESTETVKGQHKERFHFTGLLQKKYERNNPIEEITRSYHIENQLLPKMRMKWKAAHEPQGPQKDYTTIGSNNIGLLSYTIPEIENSIRRLSLQKSPKGVKQLESDPSRIHNVHPHPRGKYINRLF